jgi:hypothetical protein
VEILNLLDDHSRLAIASAVRRTTPAPDVVATFRKAFHRWGYPAGVLTDNGAIFTGEPRRHGEVALERELRGLRIVFDHPPAPTTRRPAGRSSGSTRPRRNGWPPAPPQPPPAGSRPRSTRSPATTTRPGRIEPSTDAHQPRPTPPAPRPPHTAQRSPTTTDSAAT